jgi:Family of unknown function (DUF5641)
LPNIKIDELVLIREENLPPLKWKLGRVVQVHPGNDDKVRVFSIVKIGDNTIKRPISKIAKLPISYDTPEPVPAPKRVLSM